MLGLVARRLMRQTHSNKLRGFNMIDITFTAGSNPVQKILLVEKVRAVQVEQFIGYRMSRSWGRSVSLSLEIRGDVYDKSTQGNRLCAEDVTS